MSGVGRRTQYRKHLTDSVLFDCPEAQCNERIAKVISTRGSNQFDIQLAQPTVGAGDSQGTSADLSESIVHEDRNSSIMRNSNTVLAILPTKFRTLVWVKRNDYVIVQCAEDDDAVDSCGADERSVGMKRGNDSSEAVSSHTSDEPNDRLSHATGANSTARGIRFMIKHVLYKDQIQHLVSRGFWPTWDPDFVLNSPSSSHSLPQTTTSDNGIVYDSSQALYCDDDDDTDSATTPLGDDTLFVNTNRIAKIALQDSSSDDDDD